MKKLFLMIIIILFCFSLTSCAAIKATKYSISGDIIDPVDGFYRDGEDMLIYDDSKYIVLQEIDGDCEIEITEKYILLGQRSNYPFFPNTKYHINIDENPTFITGSVSYYGTGVYLREDIYNDSMIYVLNDSSFEFELAQSFIETDKVDYDDHVSKQKYTQVVILEFYMKEIPTIMAKKWIYQIDDDWYCFDNNVAYQLSDEFVDKLTDEGIIY